MRMADMARRCQTKVIEVKAPWGQPIDPEDVHEALTQNPGVTFVALVHGDLHRCTPAIGRHRPDVPGARSAVPQYWGAERVCHHTAPINVIYALHESLRIILEEGLEQRYARHRQNSEALQRGLEAVTSAY